MEGKGREEESDFSDFSGEEDSNLQEEESEDDKSDFEESYDDSTDHDRRGAVDNETVNVKQVTNLPYDAKVDLEESFSDESIDTAEAAPSPKMRQVSQARSPSSGVGDSPPHTSPNNDNDMLSEDDGEMFGKGNQSMAEQESDDESSATLATAAKNNLHGVKLESGNAVMIDAAKRAAEKTSSKNRKKNQSEDEEEEDDDDDSSASGSPGASRAALPKGAYDPSEYEHLNVSSEVQELFQYIGRYTPHDIELESKIRCFIPDYIPAVGEIDSFLKIPRPDMQHDELGLSVLDEPASNQSDATVLELQLRAISKKSVKNPMMVRSIENANKDPRAIQGWIDSIRELHRSKPPPHVHYTRQMPDVESLMQVWPDDVEKLLNEIQLPGASIDLDLKDYVRVVCAVLDIPVYNSMIESLHVLFTLHSEFKNNQHFQNTAQFDMDESKRF